MIQDAVDKKQCLDIVDLSISSISETQIDLIAFHFTLLHFQKCQALRMSQPTTKLFVL